MTCVDLLFPILGTRLPTDHNYPLYSALVQKVPRLHEAGVEFGLAAITGHYIGQGLLQLDPRLSRLRLRVAVANIPHVLPVAGKQLRVMGQRLQLGAPQLQALKPVPSLLAHSVTIKHATDEDSFLRAAHRQAQELGVTARLAIPRHTLGRREGEARRHVLRIKSTCVICFPLLVHDLSPTDSLTVQERGLGGRRRMGGGIFLPVSEEADA
jgi:CRISPR-associated protein Cas6